MKRPDAREVVRKLKARPGRGGIRLSYDEAQLVLGMLAAGARAVLRERRFADEELDAGERFELDLLEMEP